jgi:murein L,D-transpeptidase YcbB/YkuD
MVAAEPPALERALDNPEWPDALRAFYAARAWEPVFVAAGAPRPEAAALLDAIEAIGDDGVAVPPGAARARTLLSHPPDADTLAVLEILLTSLWLEAARGLSGGRVNPSHVDSLWGVGPVARDLSAALDTAARQGRLVAALLELRPGHSGYAQLREALARYVRIADAGGWDRVAAGPRPAALRARLAAEGDLAAGAASDAPIDSAVVAAVRRFQERHGLRADGIVGDATLRALNMPAHQRVRQLVVNLERWRWLPPRLEALHLMVNIPAFELQVVEADGAAAVSRVILGRTDWRTPLVHSAVTHVVLAPPWRVPAEIARREILPLIRADTGYLGRAGFLVYREGATRPVDPALVDWSAPDRTLRVRLVQRPGPTNPLGRVKLAFKNQFAIGLHDTPAPELFGDPDRALSHGCVRVESALELAARLLREAPGWDAERLARVAGAWTTRWVALPRPVPVYVTYFTAWVDDEGAVQFRDDVYGWDERLAAALGF